MESDRIPETIDAIRARSGIERDATQSIAKTNQSLGIVKEFLSVTQRESAA
jgi:glyceraldehyde-3-phosphate dehydrogenase (NAD(P))